jgi:anti-anti-sigma factor
VSPRTIASCAQSHAELVVLDLRALDVLDSIGMDLLLAAGRRARRTGKRFVVACSPDVGWFLELIGIDRGFEVVDEPPA